MAEFCRAAPEPCVIDLDKGDDSVELAGSHPGASNALDALDAWGPPGLPDPADEMAVVFYDLGQPSEQLSSEQRHLGGSADALPSAFPPATNEANSAIGLESTLGVSQPVQSTRPSPSSLGDYASRTLRWAVLGSLFPLACAGLPGAVAQQNKTKDTSTANYRNWYIGAGLGLSVLQPDSFCRCMTISDDNDLAFNLYAGIDISQRFAIEAQYAKLGSPSVDFLGQRVGSIDYQVAGVSGLLYLYNATPFNSQSGHTRLGLSAYLKAGGGLLVNDSSLDFTQNYDRQFWVGAGLQYGFEGGWALRAEVNSYDTDARQASLSLVKRFGKRGTTRTTFADSIPAPIPVPVSAASAIPLLTEDAENVANSDFAETLPAVFFEFDKSVVPASMLQALDDVAIRLAAIPDQQVTVAGHTDSVGSENYNVVLSMKRAASVRDYLLSNGIDANRVKVLGLGELQPQADNTFEEGRAKNRRVEIMFQGN